MRKAIIVGFGDGTVGDSQRGYGTSSGNQAKADTDSRRLYLPMQRQWRLRHQLPRWDCFIFCRPQNKITRLGEETDASVVNLCTFTMRR